MRGGRGAIWTCSAYPAVRIVYTGQEYRSGRPLCYLSDSRRFRRCRNCTLERRTIPFRVVLGPTVRTDPYMFQSYVGPMISPHSVGLLQPCQHVSYMSACFRQRTNTISQAHAAGAGERRRNKPWQKREMRSSDKDDPHLVEGRPTCEERWRDRNTLQAGFHTLESSHESI
jgi:hypothetical protein